MERESAGTLVNKEPAYPPAAMIDVSLVIVNWNTRDLLLGCIRTLLEEAGTSRIEIIVVDNGSADGSADAVRERFPQVRLIENRENLGFAKANNQGIRESTGRHVCLVNSDIEALDSCVHRMREYLDVHTDIGALGPKTVNEDGTLRRNCRELPSLRNLFCQALFLDKLLPGLSWFRGRVLRGYDFTHAQEVPVLSGCFLMVRREALEQVGLLDERFFIYGEDVDWGRRFRVAGWKCVLYPGAKAVHLGGASSAADGTRFLLERLKADHQYWAKHHGPLARGLFFAVTVVHHAIRAGGWALLAAWPGAGRERRRGKRNAAWAQAAWHFRPAPERGRAP